MTRNTLFSTFVAVVVTGSFAAGIFAPELGARAQGLPELMQSLRQGGNGRELEPLNTYSRILPLIREKYYGKVDNETQMTYTAIRGLLNSLDDPYTRFLDPIEYRDLREENTGEFEGIGAKLDPQPTKEGFIRIVRPIEGGPAARAGIRRGDLIMKVDGKSIVGMDVDDAVKIIRGKAGTVVHLTVQHTGETKPVDVAITRQPVEYQVVESRMLPGNIGYVDLQQFNEMADPKLEQAIRDLDRKGMKGLILDLRGNPGGLLDAAISISSRFVPRGGGVVTIVEAGGDQDHRRTEPGKYLGGKWPLVLLVNRTSASASEIVAGAIKDNHAGTLVGTTTFGKGLVQTVVPMEDGSACMITTAHYLTPSGKDINRSRQQRGGVEPDVPVEETENQWLKGDDVQLAKAEQVAEKEVQARAGGHPGNTASADH